MLAVYTPTLYLPECTLIKIRTMQGNKKEHAFLTKIIEGGTFSHVTYVTFMEAELISITLSDSLLKHNYIHTM